MDNNIKPPERALLVGVKLPNQSEIMFRSSIEELCELTKTAGGEVIKVITQSRVKPSPHSYIGKGKVMEIKELCQQSQIDMVVFDNELTGSQTRNLIEEFNCKVIDRTELILDIFALQAKTAEAKLQVELAQLKYLLPHLVGKGVQLSRLGGGIGTRGPGETQLEYDRRRIYQRITTLTKAIENIRKNRKQRRAARKDYPVGAIVGYTNAGKSTLLNALAQSSVQIADKLFTTLDPTTRKLKLDNAREIFLTDTVGFIQNLPHHLVSAFSSTLEEVTEADFLLHVIDVTSPYLDLQLDSVFKVLKQLNTHTIPRISVLNKVDIAPSTKLCENIAHRLQPAVLISALYGKGLDKLVEAILRLPVLKLTKLNLNIPVYDQQLLSWIHSRGNIIRKEYNDTMVTIEVEMLPVFASRLKKWISKT